ncbi:TPA: EAL domain-containing protein [Pseudomonas aeruginosa]|nr:EAL domain-containing protein [Pseudomonas aeruginosa]
MAHREKIDASNVLSFRRPDVASRYCFYITIMNLRHIATSYGEDKQVVACELLLNCLHKFGVSKDKVKVLSPGTVLLEPESVPFQVFESKCELLLDAIYGEPLIMAGVDAVLSVELGVVKESDMCLPSNARGFAFVDALFTEAMVSPCVSMRDWKTTYIDQMRTVYSFYSRPFGQSYKYMPVAYIQMPELVLFDEMLLDSGSSLGNESIFSALELTGTVAYFEYRLFEMVLDVLSRDLCSNISINVSMVNFYSNVWWERVVDVLGENPEMARRIYIELTETFPLHFNKFRGERKLIDSLKKVGCHLVLDDFGSGYSSFGQAEVLEPEIIKIDKKFLHAARSGKSKYNQLKSIVRYSMEQCGFCVVEGVEDGKDLCIVESTGANLFQGSFLEKYSRTDL